MQEDGDADGGDQGGEARCVAQRPVGESLQSRRGADYGDHAADEHDGQRPTQRLSRYRIQTVSAPKAPIMKISPWAKLISWTMP